MDHLEFGLTWKLVCQSVLYLLRCQSYIFWQKTFVCKRMFVRSPNEKKYCLLQFGRFQSFKNVDEFCYCNCVGVILLKTGQAELSMASCTCICKSMMLCALKECNQKNALVTIPDWRLQLAGAAQACFQNLTRLGHWKRSAVPSDPAVVVVGPVVQQPSASLQNVSSGGSWSSAKKGTYHLKPFHVQLFILLSLWSPFLQKGKYMDQKHGARSWFFDLV